MAKADEAAIAIAGPAARPFLGRMLYEAVMWRTAAVRPPLETVLAHPDLAKWLTDWGERDGDAGVIAVLPNGVEIGAAWYRFWTDDDHSYGYVSADVPELAIAVESEYRGKGLGRMLLMALMLEARRNKVSRLSLSVEKDNYAARLYRQLQFHEVGTVGGSWTMIAEVPESA